MRRIKNWQQRQLIEYDDPHPMMQKITWLRKEYDVSLQSLADLSGISKARISYYETGRHWPSESTLSILAQALNHKIVGDKLVPDDE